MREWNIQEMLHFWQSKKLLGFFGGGYKIAEIHVLTSVFNAGDLETTTSGYFIWNNEVCVVFKGQNAGEMTDAHSCG